MNMNQPSPRFRHSPLAPAPSIKKMQRRRSHCPKKTTGCRYTRARGHRQSDRRAQSDAPMLRYFVTWAFNSRMPHIAHQQGESARFGLRRV